MEDNNEKTLLSKAKTACKNAYAPYSDFFVGAAVLGIDGNIYTGCNVENASYGLTMCAERNAISTMVANGCKQFSAIAIVSEKLPEIWPCGACRQVLVEFSQNKNATVYVEGKDGTPLTASLESLLPNAFMRTSMENG